MSTAQITSLVISLAPSLLAILTMIGVIAKVLHSFAVLKKEVADMKCIKELNSKLEEVIQENLELKKSLNEAMTMIDHVERK